MFVDTNVVLNEWYRLPLVICAVQGLLHVSWSPYVAAEVARVATRVYAEAQLASSPTRDEVMAAIGRVRDEIDHAVGLQESIWHSPEPDALQAARAAAGFAPLADERDRPVLAGAMATNSTFLLSLDSGFRHGDSFRGVAYWHPDTYLFALFNTDQDLYTVVCEEMPNQARAQLLVPRRATGT